MCRKRERVAPLFLTPPPVEIPCALPLLVSALALAYPQTYVGRRFGINATVVRVDRTEANVILHAGFVRVTAGSASLNSEGKLSLSLPLRNFLNTLKECIEQKT